MLLRVRLREPRATANAWLAPPACRKNQGIP